MSWAGKSEEIRRRFWNEDILAIRSNTEIIKQTTSDMAEKFDNTGAEINGKLDLLFSELIHSENSSENAERTNGLPDDTEKRLQYLIPKQILTNIDRTTCTFERILTGSNFKRDDMNTSEFDEYANAFLHVLFNGFTIKNFNIQLFVEMMKAVIPHESLYEIIVLRWYAIQAHYCGNVEKSISFMKDALSKAKDTKQPTWFIQDVLIDIRNEELEWDIISNVQRRESEAQKELDAIKSDLHYPIMDRQRKVTFERYVSDAYKKKVVSPRSVELVSNLSSYAVDFATEFVISFYYGSLTYMRLIYKELRIFFFNSAERYGDWYFRFGMIKMATMGDGRKTLAEIIDAYPEFLGKCTADQALEIIEFCYNEPIIHKRMINLLNSFGHLGYLLTNNHFKALYLEKPLHR